jgi:hypothetical protein
MPILASRTCRSSDVYNYMIFYIIIRHRSNKIQSLLRDRGQTADGSGHVPDPPPLLFRKIQILSLDPGATILPGLAGIHVDPTDARQYHLTRPRRSHTILNDVGGPSGTSDGVSPDEMCSTCYHKYSLVRSDPVSPPGASTLLGLIGSSPCCRLLAESFT